MSDELNTHLEQAKLMQGRILTVRAQLKKLEEARDLAIRQLDESKFNRAEIARQLGLNRSTIYLAFAKPGDEDDALYEWLAEVNQEALERWEASGQIGEPDDYFPINA